MWNCSQEILFCFVFSFVFRLHQFIRAKKKNRALVNQLKLLKTNRDLGLIWCRNSSSLSQGWVPEAHERWQECHSLENLEDPTEDPTSPDTWVFWRLVTGSGESSVTHFQSQNRSLALTVFLRSSLCWSWPPRLVISETFIPVARAGYCLVLLPWKYYPRPSSRIRISALASLSSVPLAEHPQLEPNRAFLFPFSGALPTSSFPCRTKLVPFSGNLTPFIFPATFFCT